MSVGKTTRGGRPPRPRVVRLERTCLLCGRIVRPPDDACAACGSRSYWTEPDGTPPRIPEDPDQRLYDQGPVRRGRPPKWLVRERQRAAVRREKSA